MWGLSDRGMRRSPTKLTLLSNSLTSNLIGAKGATALRDALKVNAALTTLVYVVGGRKRAR